MMGSLSDPSDFGARTISGESYGASLDGPGRWSALPTLGVLWTNDTDSLQLNPIVGADRDAANALRFGLKALAREGVPAAIAFTRVVSENDGTITSGDLADLPTA